MPIFKPIRPILGLTVLAIALVGCHAPSLIDQRSIGRANARGSNVPQLGRSTYGVQDLSQSSVTVSTVAGNGTCAADTGAWGNSDGPVSSAEFSYPRSVTVDSTGNLYVADTQLSNYSYNYDYNDFYTTYAANRSVAYTDSPDYTHVRRISSGSVSTIFNREPGVSLSVDKSGNLYFCSDLQHLWRIGLDGSLTSEIYRTNTYYVPTLNGYQVEVWHVPSYVYSDALGNCYVSEHWIYQQGPILAANMAGTITNIPATAIRSARGIVGDASGNLYICDAGDNAIKKIANGVTTTIAGGTQGYADGSGSSAQFNRPMGIAIDSDGNLIVADSGNNCIRKVTPSGAVSTIAGSTNAGFADGAGTAAQFNDPEGVAVDGKGNIYVADTNNHRIRKIATSIPLVLKVGTPYFSPNGDGVLDTASLSIQAGTAWKLSIVGQGVIATGSSNASIDWNGKLLGGSSALSDGKYNLRLEQDSQNPSVQPADGTVVIDTTPPTITNAYVKDVDVDDSGNVIYTIEAEADDSQVNSSNSGCSETSMNVTFANAEFSKQGPSSSLSSGKFDLASMLINDPGNLQALNYSVQIEDNAGNKSKSQSFKFAANIQDSVQVTASLPETSVAAYRQLGANNSLPPIPLKNGNTYYVKSGLTGVAEYRYQLIPSFQQYSPGGRQTVYIINSSSGTDYCKFTFTYGAGYSVHKFNWDGKAYGKEYAPTGRYMVSAYKGAGFFRVLNKRISNLGSWIKNGGLKLEYDVDSFKVSDYPCVSLKDWESAIPLVLSDRRAAHILDAHILSPINQNGILVRESSITKHNLLGKRRIANPNDLFSAYDSSNLTLARPEYSTIPSPLTSLNPYNNYDEVIERYTPTPYAFTHLLETTNVYQKVLKMASAVRRSPDQMAVTKNFKFV